MAKQKAFTGQDGRQARKAVPVWASHNLRADGLVALVAWNIEPLLRTGLLWQDPVAWLCFIALAAGAWIGVLTGLSAALIWTVETLWRLFISIFPF